MRAVVQRVRRCRVTVGSIDKGAATDEKPHAIAKFHARPDVVGVLVMARQAILNLD